MARLSAFAGLLFCLLMATLGGYGLVSGRYFSIPQREFVEGQSGRVIGGVILALAVYSMKSAVEQLIHGDRRPRPETPDSSSDDRPAPA